MHDGQARRKRPGGNCPERRVGRSYSINSIFVLNTNQTEQQDRVCNEGTIKRVAMLTSVIPYAERRFYPFLEYVAV